MKIHSLVRARGSNRRRWGVRFSRLRALHLLAGMTLVVLGMQPASGAEQSGMHAVTSLHVFIDGVERDNGVYLACVGDPEPDGGGLISWGDWRVIVLPHITEDPEKPGAYRATITITLPDGRTERKVVHFPADQVTSVDVVTGDHSGTAYSVTAEVLVTQDLSRYLSRPSQSTLDCGPRPAGATDQAAP